MTATTAITTGRPPGDLPERRPAGRRFDLGQPFVYLVALVVAAVAIGPVVYVFLGGFRTTADLNADPAASAPRGSSVGPWQPNRTSAI